MDSTLATNIILSILACASIFTAYIQWKSHYLQFSFDHHCVVVVVRINDSSLFATIHLIGPDPVFIDTVRLTTQNSLWLEKKPRRVLHANERMLILGFTVAPDDARLPETVMLEDFAIFNEYRRLGDIEIVCGDGVFPAPEEA